MASAMETRKIPLRATSGKRTLRFGLVSVGIAMAPATESSARVSANLVDPNTLTKVKQMYVNEAGEVVTPVKAYAYLDKFVVIENGDLPKADSDDVIELVANIAAADIPSEWVEKTYLAWPESGQHEDAYMLAATFLRANGRALVGTTVAQGTTKAFALRWSDHYGCVIAQLLTYAEMVRWDNVKLVQDGLATMAQPSDDMQQLAAKVFDGLPQAFAWESVHDEYSERLRDTIKAKATKRPSKKAAKVIPQKPADDLLAALQESIAEMKDVPEPKIKRGHVTKEKVA